ncbi:MAG TPA: hydantoinase/oxoprolinase family protein, partial [Planctomycetaceae bacterium]
DVLRIGNQDRPRLFDLAVRRPEPLFETAAEIAGRLDAAGQEVEPLDEAEVRSVLERLRADGFRSIAVCLMNAYANPAHESAVAAIARTLGFADVSVSSEVAPRIKFVPRGDTTTVDAYLNPVLRGYVDRLRGSLANAGEEDEAPAEPPPGGQRSEVRGQRPRSVPLSLGRGERGEGRDPTDVASCAAKTQAGTPVSQRSEGSVRHPLTPGPSPQGEGGRERASVLKVMSSAGGLLDAGRFTGKDSILSGPAGGVVGFSRVATAAGFPRAIGFDMGGTSTDVSRFDGTYDLEFEGTKAGVRLATPMLAIETVAAGGGSVCRFDGVKLAVGPQSAGADPGPACYGRGGPLTVTDVNLYLGKIIPARFPFPLDRAAVEQRLRDLCQRIAASPLGKQYTPHELAEGFVEIANANMVRAIRKI